jgi:hypothetical protein
MSIADRNGKQLEVGQMVCHHELTRKLTWEVTGIEGQGAVLILDGHLRGEDPSALEVVSDAQPLQDSDTEGAGGG